MCLYPFARATARVAQSALTEEKSITIRRGEGGVERMGGPSWSPFRACDKTRHPHRWGRADGWAFMVARRCYGPLGLLPVSLASPYLRLMRIGRSQGLSLHFLTMTFPGHPPAGDGEHRPYMLFNLERC